MATIGLLTSKRIIDNAEVIELLDVAQLGLEEMGLDDQAARAVHGILERTRDAVTEKPPP